MKIKCKIRLQDEYMMGFDGCLEILVTFGLDENTKRAIKPCYLSWLSLPSPTYHSFFKMVTFLFKQTLAYKYFLLAVSTPSPTTFVSMVTSSPVLTTEFTNISSQQNNTLIRPKPELIDRKILHFVYLVVLLNAGMKLCDEEDISCLYVTAISRQIELFSSLTVWHWLT